ncbi:hypothetical protein AVEN_84176-1 [Araneus ventricosus]|uniref:DNA helicase Pif1-like 2B domain-containing protein n=1 Tax=Araneus ventricosus TaxID=182803 RepID=A0A4Y2PYM2_ARAVE|nr:hypothetical protein AVEN_84176-1 [Araneus ventricosus]
MEGCITEYLSVDTVMGKKGKSYPVEFFNPIELSGIPSDKLKLKFGVPELFIRNLDVPRQRNGTRFQITHLGPNVVLATDMTGIARGESAKFYAFR